MHISRLENIIHDGMHVSEHDARQQNSSAQDFCTNGDPLTFDHDVRIESLCIVCGIVCIMTFTFFVLTLHLICGLCGLFGDNQEHTHAKQLARIRATAAINQQRII